MLLDPTDHTAPTLDRAAPTRASLERDRARQLATVRVLRPLGFLIVVLVEVSGARTDPHPALVGRGLGVLLALIGFVVGIVAVLRGQRLSPRLQVPLFVVLVGSSATLAWLQPDGPGFLGCFVAVSAATMRLPERQGLAIAITALAALTSAATFAWGRSLTGALLTDSGVVAFYVVSRLATRLRIGQDQALRLIAELEESHHAQAEAVALAERQRVARDMHDVLAHSLSGLVLQLEGARLLAERNRADPELAAAVERAVHLSRAGLQEARRAIGMLRDDELPGPDRLPALVADFERDAGIPTTLDVTGEERQLRSAARLTLYRVAQEALTNVRRHAHAASVSLSLAYEPDGARLVVEDFGGNGTAPAATVSAGIDEGGGYGITGMRERAELLGGRLDAAPTDRGFRVELWVPE
jgi:signal transduction histidine kinase